MDNGGRCFNKNSSGRLKLENCPLHIAVSSSELSLFFLPFRVNYPKQQVFKELQLYQFLPFLVLLLFIFPYLIQGESVFIPVSDNMDSNLAWWKAMKDQGKIFGGWNESIAGMIVESPRFTYPSAFSVEGLLYFLFPLFTAYLVNKVLIFILAYVAFWLWIKHQSFAKLSEKLLFLLPLLWASLAFYPHRGISIALLPVLILVFEALLQDKKSWKYFIFLVCYAFYSKLVLAGFYFFIGLTVWLLWEWIRTRTFPKYGSLGLLTLAIAWTCQEAYLIKGLFFTEEFQSHREDFTYDFGVWKDLMPWKFFWSGNQSGVHFAPIYLILTLGFLLFSEFNSLKKKSLRDLLFVLGIGLGLSVISHSSIMTFAGQFLPSLASLNFLRFEFWIPYFLFAAFFRAWASINFKWANFLIPSLLLVNIFIYQYEWRYWLNQDLKLINQQVPSFKAYYSEDSYEEIKNFLGEDWQHVRIAHLNVPPASSAYNGLLCLDGYMQNYRREHKMQVFQVIRDELAKDESLDKHFMNWGNKCYFQNAQYPDDYFMYAWREEEKIRELQFDFDFLRDSLKAEYIISALPVESSALNLELRVENPESAWKLHVYSIK
ncbi:hypothetical protein SAMN04488104_102853 [Algoriphagus faecimaris]|uniref:4-amino-4-deoxy-L-arabinose transferase n=1 Tax=Algoriphagus faecimaris TaxID=686796 RepID=A0A1G6UK64_9BACT|nr:hypothetical protein SAMN04488104_102853 [Algoriphagus faecimaris]